MSELYPLRFASIFRRYLWGGRRLGTRLGKPIGPETDYAESWEIVDHGEDQSVVIAGNLQGKTLGQLCSMFGYQLLGKNGVATKGAQGDFPLLLKFLDAGRTLSVQVHPNDQQGALLDPPDLGKTEAWYIMDAEPGSLIYAGLKPGVDAETLQQHLQDGTCDQVLHSIEAKTGDCIFIEAGTVHAIGAGLLVAEIQQASDTTFRLFDWNRTDADGKPRQLHLQQSLETIDFERGPINPQKPLPTSCPHAEQLVKCDKFVLDRWQFQEEVTIGGDKRFHILALLSGSVQIEGDPSERPLQLGESALIPASSQPVTLQTREPACLLDMYLP